MGAETALEPGVNRRRCSPRVPPNIPVNTPVKTPGSHLVEVAVAPHVADAHVPRCLVPHLTQLHGGGGGEGGKAAPNPKP